MLRDSNVVLVRRAHAIVPGTQRGVAYVVGDVNVGLAVEQQSHHITLVVPTRSMQRCISLLRASSRGRRSFIHSSSQSFSPLARASSRVPPTGAARRSSARTKSVTSTLAPNCSNMLAAPTWPSRAALWRAVSPLYACIIIIHHRTPSVLERSFHPSIDRSNRDSSRSFSRSLASSAAQGE